MSSTGTVIRNVRWIDPRAEIDRQADVYICQDEICEHEGKLPAGASEIDGSGCWALPGLVDLQVHFRQPGDSHKETIESGSQAALAGGVTTAVVMPNTKPPLDSHDAVAFQISEAARVGGIQILVAAAATKGLEGKELTDYAALKAAGAVAITDDGLPVLEDDVMQASLESCAMHDLLFMQHAEDTRVSKHAPMTLGPTSEAIGVDGQPADAEGMMVERDIALLEKTGGRYHVLHTSTARSLRAIRAAKKAGLSVTCEASPHHLLLTDEACAGRDPNTKMNPPLRNESDRQTLIECLIDGTVDAVATDHAPHSIREKNRGFVEAPFGVVGLETAFAAVLGFVHSGDISVQRAVELMTSSPARTLGLEEQIGTTQGVNAARNLCIVDPNMEWTLTKAMLSGRSKNSPFLGRQFKGRVLTTFLNGAQKYSHLNGQA
jgi:dihydroorotase